MGYFMIAPVCFLIDQICKTKAVEKMDKTTQKPILNNNIILKLNYNEGAFMGLLKKNKGLLLVLNIASLAFLIVLFFTYVFIKGEYFIKLGLSLMTGGAVSNIYDRLKRKKVVDYFAFKFKPNIIFNLADMFVFLGGLLILIGSFFNHE